MNNFNHLIINKNRGWRGLAKVIIRNESYEEQLQMIFSFSQLMWDDLIKEHSIVVQDNKYYYILKFYTVGGKLPEPTQQRSVLIKNYVGKIMGITRYDKTAWTLAAADDWIKIKHFIQNKNNHTTSDWNCIGIRVIPEI